MSEGGPRIAVTRWMQEDFQAFREILRERGADALWLGVMVKNTRALEWYRRIGFTFVEESPFVMGASSADHLIGFREVKP